jgi:hypothetical protein
MVSLLGINLPSSGVMKPNRGGYPEWMLQVCCLSYSGTLNFTMMIYSCLWWKKCPEIPTSLWTRYTSKIRPWLLEMRRLRWKITLDIPAMDVSSSQMRIVLPNFVFTCDSYASAISWPVFTTGGISWHYCTQHLSKPTTSQPWRRDNNHCTVPSRMALSELWTFIFSVRLQWSRIYNVDGL